MIGTGRAAVLLGLLLLAAPFPLAEVAVDALTTKHPGLVLMSGGGDDPTPWPTWDLVRTHVDRSAVLNAGGEANGDGPPSWGRNPHSGEFEVVWAWFDGVDHEIALSRWTGDEWSQHLLLTDNEIDDVDPRISWLPNGARKVTWWRPAGADSEDEVWFRQQDGAGGSVDPSDGDWTSEERVSATDEIGEQSDVAGFNGSSWVAYQNGDASPTSIVAVNRQQDTWHGEPIGQSLLAPLDGERTDADPRIHVAEGRMWVDWSYDETLLAFSSYDPKTGLWSDTEHEDYSDEADRVNEPIARAWARARIRRQVLSSPPDPDAEP